MWAYTTRHGAQMPQAHFFPRVDGRRPALCRATSYGGQPLIPVRPPNQRCVQCTTLADRQGVGQ